MSKILLFYKYVTVSDPKRLMKSQRLLCEQLKLTGRILIAPEGINGTLGGTDHALEAYKSEMLQDPRFSDIDFKESSGSHLDFPRLRIAIRPEIVSLGLDPEKINAKDGGIHLTPEATHSLLEEQPEDLVILDARNNYESQIGTFKNSITPDIENFRDLPKFIDENLKTFEGKRVLMHCTGGIRCERASTYLKSKNVATQVYQIQGGIHRYIEKYPNGHFRGKLYVFDGRVAVKVNEDILGSCYTCQSSCDEYTNCINTLCNNQVILCAECIRNLKNCCSVDCLNLVENKKVTIRAIPKSTKQKSEKKESCKIS